MVDRCCRDNGGMVRSTGGMVSNNTLSSATRSHYTSKYADNCEIIYLWYAYNFMVINFLFILDAPLLHYATGGRYPIIPSLIILVILLVLFFGNGWLSTGDL